MFDFIKKRDAQTQARKRMKKDLDEIFEFNNEEKQQHTLNHIVQLANNDLKEIGWVRLLMKEQYYTVMEVFEVI